MAYVTQADFAADLVRRGEDLLDWYRLADFEPVFRTERLFDNSDGVSGHNRFVGTLGNVVAFIVNIESAHSWFRGATNQEVTDAGFRRPTAAGTGVITDADRGSLTRANDWRILAPFETEVFAEPLPAGAGTTLRFQTPPLRTAFDGWTYYQTLALDRYTAAAIRLFTLGLPLRAAVDLTPYTERQVVAYGSVRSDRPGSAPGVSPPTDWIPLSPNYVAAGMSFGANDWIYCPLFQHRYATGPQQTGQVQVNPHAEYNRTLMNLYNFQFLLSETLAATDAHSFLGVKSDPAQVDAWPRNGEPLPEEVKQAVLAEAVARFLLFGAGGLDNYAVLKDVGVDTSAWGFRLAESFSASSGSESASYSYNIGADALTNFQDRFNTHPEIDFLSSPLVSRTAWARLRPFFDIRVPQSLTLES